MKKRISLVTVLVVGCIVVASCAQAAMLGKGAAELSGSAGFNSTSSNGNSVSAFLVNAQYGYCLDSHWEIAPALVLSSYSGGGSTLTSYTATGNVYYNFPSAGGGTLPYLTAGVGFGSIASGGSSISATVLPTVGAGLRTMMGNSASVNFGAFYQRETWSSHGESIDSNIFGLQVGLSVYPMGFHDH